MLFNVAIEKIERMVERKISGMGRGLINNVLAQTPVGFALGVMNRLDTAIETGGGSELERLAKDFVAQITPRPLPYTATVRRLLKPRRKAKWERGGWAWSRQQWLAEGWMHDWRSQPRNPAGGALHWSGAWIEGRLPYPVTTTATVSRKLRRQRKQRRAWRAAGRSAATTIMSSWSSE